MDTPEKKPDFLVDHLIAEGKLKEAQSRFREFLDACEEEKDTLLQNQSRLSSLANNEMLGIIPEDSLEYNRILWNFSSQLRKFRREVLAKYFDIRDRDDYFKQTTDRDTIIKDILALRLQPKNFYIEELITEGNSSLVYRLFNNVMNRHAVAVVLKLPKLTEAAKADIESLVDLRHRNLIKLIDYDISAYPCFVVKEFVYGTTLQKAIEMTGPRPVSQTMDWLYQLTSALEYLRQKRILHTNIRPSKIYVDDEWQVMISPLDMRSIHAGEFSYHRFLDGLRYGSPETIEQLGQPLLLPKDADTFKKLCASDQYALGLLGYKLLTGDDLFEGDNVYETIESRKRFAGDSRYRKQRLAMLAGVEGLKKGQSKAGIVKIFEQLLAEKPENRFDNFKQLLRALHAYTRNDYSNQSLARGSYRRALATNREFIRDFYTAFFQKAPATEAAFNFIGKKRQLAMLQMAIDVILDIDGRQVHLSRIMDGEHHRKFSLPDFEIFIDVLIDTIRNNDPRFDTHTQEEWAGLREKVMKVISDKLSHKVSSD